jgi:hypothetical protein
MRHVASYLKTHCRNIEVVGIPCGKNGAFEVVDVTNGEWHSGSDKVYWSKLNGDGFLERPQDLQMVAQMINADAEKILKKRQEESAQ